MNRYAVVALAPLAVAAPASAQATNPSMPGMQTPTSPAARGSEVDLAKPALEPEPNPRARVVAASSPPMTDMAGMQGMATPSAATDAAPALQGVMASTPAMAEPTIPRAPGPTAPLDHAADDYFDPAAMSAARAQLRQEHGAAIVSMVAANLAEYQARPGGGGYRWEGEAWIGGDVDRFVVKSEGDGGRRAGLGAAEVQGLYAHPIGPYFDFQGGVRQDFAPRGRTYATLGFQGLAPFWFDVSGALFLSTRGEVLARLESTYELRLTQRLILQPRAELNFAAQTTAQTRTGSGLSNAELGLRLRYELTREIAPYIGASWDRKVGQTAVYARARGEDADGATFVAGIRAWF